MATIEVYRNKALLGSFLLTTDIISVGRAGDNEIVLADERLKVSRHHAVLLRQNGVHGQYAIRDLSSAGGIKVGNRPVFQKVLTHGEEIRICDFFLRYYEADQDDNSLFRITDAIQDEA